MSSLASIIDLIMDVEIVSIEVIKPSQPTPPNLKTLQFSIIDQFAPHAFGPFLFFYSPLAPANINDPSQTLTLLKSSLSEALTLFYPFAGRIKDNHHIDCSDDGVKFVHARVLHRSLSQALCPPPNSDQMRQLFPTKHTVGQELLGVQVSFFECGGIAIGLYLSHKISDARGHCTFMLGWASIAKCGSSVLQPRFDLASVFPPIEVVPSLGEFPEVSAAVIKVFRFEASKIAELKAKVKANADEKDPSRMTAVTAFLWSIFAAMGRGQKGNPRQCILSMPVNLRGSAPGLHDHTMGNAVMAASLTVPMAPQVDLTEMPELVKEMRELVKRVNEGGLVKRKDGGEILKMKEAYLECYNKAYSSKGELGLYEVSSLLRFPFYEADFGWGKPAWVGILNDSFSNVVIYLETKFGDGIDAWVTMTKEDMAQFESMPELLQYATPLHNALKYSS